MNDINYICARWRDAITDPPSAKTPHHVRTAGGDVMIGHINNGHWWVSDMIGRCSPAEQWNDGVTVVQWLDITDEPAVAASEIETLVTAAFVRRYPGGRPEPQEVPCHEARVPEPAEIEAQRTLLIEEMVDHGMHAEDAALSVDGLIGVCQRGTVPRAAVQAAVDEMTKYADEIPGTRCARGLKWARAIIRNYTRITPTEGGKS